jgi:23S rRNA (cytosine1962-C5)-methyltransferase
MSSLIGWPFTISYRKCTIPISRQLQLCPVLSKLPNDLKPEWYMNNAVVFLKESGPKSVQRRHPWVFSGKVGRVEGAPENGQTVLVKDRTGNDLGLAAWSPSSQIRLRFWTFDSGQAVDPAFFRYRLAAAADLRKALPEYSNAEALRLVHGETDGLPGVVVDRYGDYLVVQLMTAGAEYHREIIFDALEEQFQPRGIFERSDLSVRKKEGLKQRSGCARGEEPPELVQFTEDGRVCFADLRNGHKTGFYLDQRLNRQIVQNYSSGRRVLNCFSYTGTFSIAALKGGAEQVVSVDSSQNALEMARQISDLNHIPREKHTLINADVFTQLREWRDANEQFDLIILDPPKFAETRAQVSRAARAYKDINLLAFKLLRPGGLLFTFSCSAGMDAPLFQKIVADAALDAGRNGRILRQMSQAPDHPVGLNFPEGFYLKGLVAGVE